MVEKKLTPLEKEKLNRRQKVYGSILFIVGALQLALVVIGTLTASFLLIPKELIMTSFLLLIAPFTGHIFLWTGVTVYKKRVYKEENEVKAHQKYKSGWYLGLKVVFIVFGPLVVLGLYLWLIISRLQPIPPDIIFWHTIIVGIVLCTDFFINTVKVTSGAW